uniref:Uncharacterized protein n=1 Tax=Rhizophora mucronata TaxID=61149 RepID=A0A2P2QXF8_RHIMU
MCHYSNFSLALRTPKGSPDIRESAMLQEKYQG